MASWSDVSLAAPAFAAAVRAILDAHKHKILATLRKDGSPRISGIEVDFVDGELWLGAMWQSRKALDLQRDPRFALHSATADDGEAWRGDAKIAGWVEEVTDPERKRTVQAASGGGAPPGPFHLFRAEVTEVVLVRVGAPPDHLVVESWHEGRGLQQVERR
ncbi:MAG: Pyridoxamine 5-phosphate oxidase-related FMN-binding protein [Thermomicrobiales bacterium]|nr:Pyridoxamine 5-phosphate oxidase-related FMN-binding protein [Thermomicrobiales bacterium]